MTNKQKALLSRCIATLIVLVCSLFVLVPFALVLLNSFKTPAEAKLFRLTLPITFQWENYAEAIRRAKLFRALGNSLIFSLGHAVLGCLTCMMTAYYVSRRDDKLARIVYRLYFAGLIASLSFVSVIRIMKLFGLLNTYTGIILQFTANASPFIVFLYCGFIQSVPRDLDEAGVIDGCSPWTLFTRVVAPILQPVTITAFTLLFLGAWNDMMTPLYVLNQSSKWGVVLSVYNFFSMYDAEWNLVCAVIVLSTVPVLVVYLFCQKYIISGMAAGAVKG